jgi:hypothetical protein
MVLVSAVQIGLGFVWHVGYRARRHWSLKREGALAAAAGVMLLGAADLTVSALSEAPHAAVARPGAVASAPVHTAVATPVITEAARPIQILPATASVDTVAAAPSPSAESTDLIGAKITERLGEEIATGTITPAAARPIRPAP